MRLYLICFLVLVGPFAQANNNQRCGWEVAREYISCFDDQIPFRDISDSFFHAMNRHCYECSSPTEGSAKTWLQGVVAKAVTKLEGTGDACKDLYRKAMVETYPSLNSYFKDKCDIDSKKLAADAGIKAEDLKTTYAQDINCQYVDYMTIENLTPYKTLPPTGYRHEPEVLSTQPLCSSVIKCEKTSYDVVAGDYYDMYCHGVHCLDDKGQVTHDRAIACFRDLSLERGQNNLIQRGFQIDRSEPVEVEL